MLKRKHPIKRSAVKPRNRKRHAANHERAYGSEERIAFVKSLACLALTRGVTPCLGPIENAHISTGGMGRKAGADRIVPLCLGHHAELHQHGARTFAWTHGLVLAEHAARTELQWQLHVREAAGAAQSLSPQPLP